MDQIMEQLSWQVSECQSEIINFDSVQGKSLFHTISFQDGSFIRHSFVSTFFCLASFRMLSIACAFLSG